MSKLKIIVKLTATVIISLSIAACVTTKGGNSGQSDTGRVVTGAAAGGAIGLIGCKLLGGKNCEKYAVAGAVVGGVTAHLLNQRQKAAYEAALAANAKVELVKRPDTTEKKDVVVSELYEPSSAKFLPDGKEKFRKTVFNESALAEGKTAEVLAVYTGGSVIGRLLAEERAKNAQEEFGQQVPDGTVFGTMEAHENLPEGSQIVIR